jgi:hypothetical protein
MRGGAVTTGDRGVVSSRVSVGGGDCNRGAAGGVAGASCELRSGSAMRGGAATTGDRGVVSSRVSVGRGDGSGGGAGGVWGGLGPGD